VRGQLATRHLARRLGLDAGQVRDNFRDWWHAATGARATKRDWPATWRVWCRREIERRLMCRQRNRTQIGNQQGDAHKQSDFDKIRKANG
jgi:hypothetical protein